CTRANRIRPNGNTFEPSRYFELIHKNLDHSPDLSVDLRDGIYGDKPGWIWKHNASYDGDTHALVVSEGEQLLSANPFAKHQLQGVWELDLATNSWSKRD
ncbi:MAG: hypothetical protein KA260_04870, partial [Burkholderiales bacterium]|nr:hypothetical protein [Burkholderiales bacterium]